MPIDLRSDTLTLPTDAMREAIAQAQLGDDVYGEDPTVNRLEQLAAERTGKPAALLLPSGTMGNLCAVLAHCGRGDAAIVGDQSHIYHYEAGGASVLGGVALHTVPTAPSGELALPALTEALGDPSDTHQALSRLICLESSHNRCGGVVLSLDYMRQVRKLADDHGLAVHLDGARLFNAALALRTDPRKIAQYTDSVMFCLSKGLSAPAGSLLAGEEALVQRARRLRKMLGGGMRQVGVIAAAGIVALEQLVSRLAEDHVNARLLATGLAALPNVSVDLATVQTNIVLFRLVDTPFSQSAFIHLAAERGVLIGEVGRGYLRAVTHRGVSADDVAATLSVLGGLLG